jgi:hypothetical protein
MYFTVSPSIGILNSDPNRCGFVVSDHLGDWRYGLVEGAPASSLALRARVPYAMGGEVRLGALLTGEVGGFGL